MGYVRARKLGLNSDHRKMLLVGIPGFRKYVWVVGGLTLNVNALSEEAGIWSEGSPASSFAHRGPSGCFRVSLVC